MAACLALASGLILWRTMPPRWVALTVLVRFGIAVLYFLWFADGRWTMLDDVTYLRQGTALMEAGYDALTVLTDRAAFSELVLMSGGFHVLYAWVNLVWVSLVGPWYFVPVLGNVFLTFLAARVLWGLARDAGFGPRYASALAVFFLLHWDVIAWSSFVNLKDTLVLLLTVVLMRALVQFTLAPHWRPMVIAALTGFAFLWLRFYVPVVAVLALAVRSASTGGFVARYRWRVMSLAVVGMAAVAAWLGPTTLQLLDTRLVLSPASVGLGFVRMLLGPQPWSLSPEHDFLLLPTILHLTFVVPTILGAVMLWRMAPPVRLPLLYTGVILVLFAAFPEQQGPRHRYQVVFMTAWAQLTVLWELARALGRLQPAARPEALA